MKNFSTFYFEKYSFNTETLEATFYYNFDKELFFEEKICFSDDRFVLRKDLKDDIIQNILFHMHLALGISYYKFYPTQSLVIQTAKLTKEQIKFWKKFYINGLWEFFYRNQLSPEGLLNFSSNAENEFKKVDFNVSEKYMVPIGGGKDSIVSIELLKQLGKEIDGVTFAQKDNILYENTSQNAQIKRLFIKRELSKNILEVISEGAYNGHVPITGIIAFVLEMACYLYDYKYIVLSNELSANFWNTLWYGVEINHQWSKSLDFEKDFWEYVLKYISSEVKYFSFLRPFYEIKIAEMFSLYAKKYFTNFSSCNTNFKIFSNEKKNTYWCNNCPKCAFVYAILRPYLTKDETLSIFWKELYEDTSLEILFRELAGISGIKPFECVGTNEEVILAMKMAYERWQGKIPFVLEIFKNQIHSNMSESDFERLKTKLMLPNFEENIIPKNLLEELKTLPLWKDITK